MATESVETAATVTADSANYTWTLEAQQQQGYLWLSWRTNAPFRAQQGQISIYADQAFPSNPQANRKEWRWDGEAQPWNTGLPWGTGWYCAWIAQISPNGPYTYVARLCTHELSSAQASRPAKSLGGADAAPIRNALTEALAPLPRGYARTIDDIADLIGSIDGLPSDLGSNKDKYLRAGYGRKRHR
jgi:hypothetical protein